MTEPQGKVSPSDLMAEQTVLGSVMLDKAAFPKICATLTPDSFYWEKHGIIYSAMEALYRDNLPIDEITISDKLTKLDKLEEVGGHYYITELTETVPFPRNVEYYAKIVQDMYILRTVDEVCNESSKEVFLPGADPDTVLNAAIQRFELLRARKSLDMRTMEALVESTLAEITANLNKDTSSNVPTFRRNLDEVTTGFKPGKVTLLAGESSSGKSAFVQEQSYLLAKHGVNVMFASREMQGEEITARWISMVAYRELIGKIPYFNLEKGDWLSANAIKCGVVEQAAKKLRSLPIYVLDEVQCPTMTTTDIRAAFTKCMARNKKAKWIGVIDYVQILDAEQRHGQSRENVVAQISSSILTIAKTLQIHIIALVQLNKSKDYRTEYGRPTLHSIRESSALGNDAQNAWSIYKDMKRIEDGEIPETETELLILKGRSGPKNVKPIFHFMPPYGVFLTEEEKAELEYKTPEIKELMEEFPQQSKMFDGNMPDNEPEQGPIRTVDAF